MEDLESEEHRAQMVSQDHKDSLVLQDNLVRRDQEVNLDLLVTMVPLEVLVRPYLVVVYYPFKL